MANSAHQLPPGALPGSFSFSRLPRFSQTPPPSPPTPRRASVIGAGSFGTAVAVLLVRAGVRTTLLSRTPEQAERLREARENEHYLPGVALPERLEVRVVGGVDDQFRRADLIFVAVPSSGLREALD